MHSSTARLEVTVSARASPLSQAQVKEIAALLPEIHFIPHFVESTGDRDQNTSLRTLEKTDFFTKEIDAQVLNGKCRISVHSAKDLPEPLPKGLEMIALTRGQDPSDSLVLKEGFTLETLEKGAVIATSSPRREECVRALRSDLSFCDIRGTIETRLKKLLEPEIYGVVLAEAALIRLKLTHLNRITLPGPSTLYQGQLAILAQANDEEMRALFAPLDVRHLPKALYLGPRLPTLAFRDRWLHHAPLIRTEPLHTPTLPILFHIASHLILTSKNAVAILMDKLQDLNLIHELKQKEILCIGKATAEALSFLPNTKIAIAKEETQEGLLALVEKLPQDTTCLLYPRSILARPFLRQEIEKKGYRLLDLPLYKTVRDPVTTLPDLHPFQEILFSSPSTVDAFFDLNPIIPKHTKLQAIGSITEQHLKFKQIATNQINIL